MTSISAAKFDADDLLGLCRLRDIGVGQLACGLSPLLGGRGSPPRAPMLTTIFGDKFLSDDIDEPAVNFLSVCGGVMPAAD